MSQRKMLSQICSESVFIAQPHKFLFEQEEGKYILCGVRTEMMFTGAAAETKAGKIAISRHD